MVIPEAGGVVVTKGEVGTYKGDNGSCKVLSKKNVRKQTFFSPLIA